MMSVIFIGVFFGNLASRLAKRRLWGSKERSLATSQPHDSLLHMISYVRTIGSLPLGETTGNMFCICFGTRQQVQDLGDNCLVFITQ